VDTDEVLRGGDPTRIAEVQAAIADYLDEAPGPRRWGRRDALLWALAGEPRADALAWTRVRELLAPLVDGPSAAAHPAAIAALERAMSTDAEAADLPPGAGLLLGD